MSIHVVLEIVYGNEGNPGIHAFHSEKMAISCQKKLVFENGKDNEEVLVIRQKIEFED